ncbi:pleiotropic regulatory protein RsmS [Photobacterium chitinilyticum]|uniref:DUF2496 domain-containing protein n=1 Tax=Photobacterium chitinilyticum TaxID=2485123 RepID=A0A3S3R0R3_9GAMM|nr:pleiotropic regulatory protein RsmS [Photobacterium chitinilyticum]RWX55163.1 DUF2496 domain-containing protein [Photobacterium chitinilyticum]
MKNDNSTPSLDDAPKDIKLAVDLIYLFESNEIPPDVALSALKIVAQDLKAQMNKENPEKQDE